MSQGRHLEGPKGVKGQNVTKSAAGTPSMLKSSYRKER